MKVNAAFLTVDGLIELERTRRTNFRMNHPVSEIQKFLRFANGNISLKAWSM